MRNHLGTYECKLCLTLHNTEVAIYIMIWCIPSCQDMFFQGSYLVHTQGKKHQSNLLVFYDCVLF